MEVEYPKGPFRNGSQLTHLGAHFLVCKLVNMETTSLMRPCFFFSAVYIIHISPSYKTQLTVKFSVGESKKQQQKWQQWLHFKAQ